MTGSTIAAKVGSGREQHQPGPAMKNNIINGAETSSEKLSRRNSETASTTCPSEDTGSLTSSRQGSEASSSPRNYAKKVDEVTKLSVSEDDFDADEHLPYWLFGPQWLQRKVATACDLKYAEDLRTFLIVGIFYTLLGVRWHTWTVRGGGNLFPDKWFYNTNSSVTDVTDNQFHAISFNVALYIVMTICDFAWLLTAMAFGFYCATIVHNCIHFSQFRAYHMNTIWNVVLTHTYGFPVSALVAGHNLSHHRFTNTAKDVHRTTKMLFKQHWINCVSFVAICTPHIMKTDHHYFEKVKERGNRLAKENSGVEKKAAAGGPGEKKAASTETGIDIMGNIKGFLSETFNVFVFFLLTITNGQFLKLYNFICSVINGGSKEGTDQKTDQSLLSISSFRTFYRLRLEQISFFPIQVYLAYYYPAQWFWCLLIPQTTSKVGLISTNIFQHDGCLVQRDCGLTPDPYIAEGSFPTRFPVCEVGGRSDFRIELDGNKSKNWHGYSGEKNTRLYEEQTKQYEKEGKPLSEYKTSGFDEHVPMGYTIYDSTIVPLNDASDDVVAKKELGTDGRANIGALSYIKTSIKPVISPRDPGSGMALLYDPDYNFARDFTGSVLNFWTCNNGYHSAHHTRPSCHWTKLPRYWRREIMPRQHPACIFEFVVFRVVSCSTKTSDFDRGF